MTDLAQQVAERAFINAQRNHLDRITPPEPFDDPYWAQVEAAWAKFTTLGTSA